MVGRLQKDTIWWDDFPANPAVVDGIDEFIGDIGTKTFIPAVLEPLRQFLCAVTVNKLGVQFPLLGQAGIRQVAATQDDWNGIETISGR